MFFPTAKLLFRLSGRMSFPVERKKPIIPYSLVYVDTSNSANYRSILSSRQEAKKHVRKGYREPSPSSSSQWHFRAISPKHATLSPRRMGFPFFKNRFLQVEYKSIHRQCGCNNLYFYIHRDYPHKSIMIRKKIRHMSKVGSGGRVLTSN